LSNTNNTSPGKEELRAQFPDGFHFVSCDFVKVTVTSLKAMRSAVVAELNSAAPPRMPIWSNAGGKVAATVLVNDPV
jgi:hypothetical protein